MQKGTKTWHEYFEDTEIQMLSLMLTGFFPVLRLAFDPGSPPFVPLVHAAELIHPLGTILIGIPPIGSGIVAI